MNTALKNLLFIDIETVSQQADFEMLSPTFQQLWTKKAEKNLVDKTIEEIYFERAGIYAEFGKIITIAVGFFFENDNKELAFKVKCLKSHDEKELLEEFSNLISRKKFTLVAHNGKEFDFPYLGRRMLINGVKIPPVLDISGKKPWEISHLDTMEMWKFGDWKSYTSLDLLAAVFGIESSKDDIDGSQVNRVYHLENDLDRISYYCMKDVIVTAKVFLKLKGLELPSEEQIFIS